MMINWSKLLHQVIDLEWAIDDHKELLLGPEARQQTIFVALDVELAKFAESIDWFDVLTKKKIDHEEVVNRYLRVLELFLLYSAKKQWTHLIVMDEKQWQLIQRPDKTDKLVELNKQYLAIKHFLGDAYYEHRQESFRHAWHLIVKWGLVDLQLSPDEVTAGYQSLIESEHAKWAE
ncbi:hypothetical protein AALA17_01115 [Lactobacillaceae bacterium 24-114]